VDLIISCGDLPPYYLEYIVTMLNKPLYYVIGNHGSEIAQSNFGESPKGPAGCTNLDGRVVNHKGLLIAGLEGSMRYNWDSNYQYTEFQMRQKALSLLPRLFWNKLWRGRYLDILVTHAPPCGIHDEEDVCHTGFKSFIWLMDWFSPRYLLHGHVHLYMPNQCSRSVYKKTEILNTYGYKVLELDVPPNPIDMSEECQASE